MIPCNQLYSILLPRAPRSTLFPYTTLFRSSLSFINRSTVYCSPFCRNVTFASHASLLCSFGNGSRSEEHTSELQSRFDLVCRLLLEKKKPSSFLLSRWRSRSSGCSTTRPRS